MELHHGIIPDHQFNESINGVFRQAKKDHENAKEVKMELSVKKQKTAHNQQKMNKMFCSKTLTSSAANKITTICTNSIWDNDDDN